MEENKSWREWLNEYALGLYDKWGASHIYDTYTSKTTVVVLTLKSGFQLTGTSHCEDPSKFSESLGHRFALQDALDKLGQLDAFYNAQQKYEEHSKKVAAIPVESVQPEIAQTHTKQEFMELTMQDPKGFFVGQVKNAFEAVKKDRRHRLTKHSIETHEEKTHYAFTIERF